MTTDKNNSRQTVRLRGETENVVFTSCSRSFPIDTQAIRSKILDLAMRGKLTEQLPEDGTAEELYRQIQSKKQALIKAGKLKKEKPSATIPTAEISFEIPANWKWVRLGSIGITVTGGTPSKTLPTYYGGSYPFFKPSDLDAGRHITKASEYLTEEGKKVSRQLQQGSILVCCIGSIGKAAIIDTDGTANQQITALTPLKSDSDYLLYAISCRMFQHQLEQGARATTVSIINKSKFENCILPLPPLAEQRRIVERIAQAFSILDTIDALQSQYADNLTVLKSKLIDAAIQGKLTEQLPEDGTAEELYRQIQVEKQALVKAGKLKKEKPLLEISDKEVPFEIPSNWKWVRLGSICSIINGDRGKNYPAKSTLKHEGIPFISALNLNGVSVTKDEHLLCLDDCQYERLGNGKLQKDDIVICIRGSLGKHGRYPFEKGAIASSLVISRLYYSRKIMGDYEMLWLDSSAFPAEIDRYDSGTAQPNLAANNLEKFLIPLPPLAEQKRIVARLEELLPLCEKRS